MSGSSNLLCPGVGCACPTRKGVYFPVVAKVNLILRERVVSDADFRT
jgi:hypothetical protein